MASIRPRTLGERAQLHWQLKVLPRRQDTDRNWIAVNTSGELWMIVRAAWISGYNSHKDQAKRGYPHGRPAKNRTSR